MYAFHCPRGKAKLKTSGPLAGQQVTCPTCGHQILTPSAPNPAPPPTSAPASPAATSPATAARIRPQPSSAVGSTIGPIALAVASVIFLMAGLVTLGLLARLALNLALAAPAAVVAAFRPPPEPEPPPLWPCLREATYTDDEIVLVQGHHADAPGRGEGDDPGTLAGEHGQPHSRSHP